MVESIVYRIALHGVCFRMSEQRADKARYGIVVDEDEIVVTFQIEDIVIGSEVLPDLRKGTPNGPFDGIVLVHDLVVFLQAVPLDEVLKIINIFLDVSVHDESDFVEPSSIDHEILPQIAIQDVKIDPTAV